MNTINAPKCYAAYSKDTEIRRKSSSGGIFTLLAENCIRANGAVYGVAMSQDCMTAELIRVIHQEDLSKLRCSKYLQAKVGNTYRQVKADLQSGLSVLFSGTPCQINGLKAYLGREYDNLLCVDIICHGVPSPALWRKYAEYRETEYGGKLIGINFRCKDSRRNDIPAKGKGVEKHHKEVYIPKEKDPYLQLFLMDCGLRPSCYACKARKVQHSDITIADFWGIESVAPEMSDGSGTSLVIVRTKNGQNAFQKIENGMQKKEVSYEDAVRRNPTEYQSPVRPPQRDTFFADMKALSFPELEREYITAMPAQLKKKIKKTVKRIILHTPIRRLFRRRIYKGSGNGTYGLLFTLENDVSHDKKYMEK